MLSRHEYERFCDSLYSLALDIGLRPACRAIGISEAKGMKISSRRKWNLAKLSPALTTLQRDIASQSASVSEPLKAKAKIMQTMADRTRLAMARTSQRAFEHSDTLSDEQLHELPRAVALEKHGRNASLAHGWSQANLNVGVQVNVPMPDQNERDEMRSIDQKLDAIAAKLKNS